MIRIPTYGGRFVDIMNPSPADFKLDDIARSHSGCPRYLGHSLRPYSIGEHAVKVAVVVAKLTGNPLLDTARECLLHDAHEAYMGEIPRMIKHSPLMAEYRAVEQNVDIAIRSAFGLAETMPPFIHQVDRAICRAEIHSGLFKFPWGDSDTDADNGDPMLSKAIICELSTHRSALVRQWGWDPVTTYFTFLQVFQMGVGYLV